MPFQMIGHVERHVNPQYRGRNVFVLAGDGNIIEQTAWWANNPVLSATCSAIYMCEQFTKYDVPVERTVVDWDRGVFWKINNHAEVRLKLAC